MSGKNKKKGDLDSLLENIDKQLLLKLLDSLITEQNVKTTDSQG